MGAGAARLDVCEVRPRGERREDDPGGAHRGGERRLWNRRGRLIHVLNWEGGRVGEAARGVRSRAVSTALAVRSGNQSPPPWARPSAAPSAATRRTARIPVTKTGIWAAGAATSQTGEGGGRPPVAAARVRRTAGKPRARAEGSLGSSPVGGGGGQTDRRWVGSVTGEPCACGGAEAGGARAGGRAPSGECGGGKEARLRRAWRRGCG